MATKKKPAHTAEAPKVDALDLGAQYKTEKVVEDEGGEDMYRLVRITIPVALRIARTDYPAGTHDVPYHMVDTIIEMVDKKKRADLSIFTGNNYLVNRMMDRSLVVTKVDKL